MEGPNVELMSYDHPSLERQQDALTEKAGQMPGYRFLFSNDLPNSTGHVFHTCQREIEVLGKTTLEEALEAAKAEFERQEGVASWTHRAHFIECKGLERTEEPHVRF